MNEPRQDRRPELETVLDAALEDRTPDALSPEARAQLDQARQALQLVDELPRPTPSPDLRRRLERRLDEVDARAEASLGRRFLRALTLRPAWAVGVGAGVAAAAAAALFFLSGPRTSPTGGLPPEALARVERLELAEDLEVYENLEVLEHLDVIEDLELIAALPEGPG